jgi:exonuclease SbcC
MKILAIRLRNLASIEALDVDFMAEPLRSAGIFAISGPTGSGKSTILDALCLSLYDKTPRFASTAESVSLTDVGGGTINQSDVKNILRRGTSEGYAEADFRGVDGKIYRSKWSVRRARNRANGSMQAQTMQVTDLTDGVELQGTKKELLARLVTAIGLSYEQFTRTVLLAQNDFATFLKSKDADKAELLEKLTGTEIYSRISSEVYRRNKEVKEELTLLRNNMAQVNVLTKEQVEELVTKSSGVADAHKAEQERWKTLSGQQNIVRRYKQQQEALDAKKVDLKRCRDSMDRAGREYEERTAMLKELNDKCEALRPDLQRAREQDVRLQSMIVAHDKLTEQLRISDANLSEAVKRAAELDAERKRNVDELSKLTHGDDAETIFKAQRCEIDSLNDRREKKNKEIEAIDIKSVSDSKTALVKRHDELAKALTALVELSGLKTDEGRMAADYETAVIDRKIQEELFTRTKAMYEDAQLAVSKNVKSLRSELKAHKPCPVCGSLDHPYADSNDVAETLFNTIKTEYDDAAVRCEQLRLRIVQLQKDMDYNKRQILERTNLIDKCSVVEHTEAGFKSEIASAEEHLLRIEEKMRLYQRLYSELQKLDGRLSVLRHDNEKLRVAMEAERLSAQRCASFAEQLNILTKAASDNKKQLEQSGAELDKLRTERAALLKGKSADEAEQAVMRRRQELTDALDKAREVVNAGNSALSGITGELKQMEESIMSLKVEYDKIENTETLDAAIAGCVKHGNELLAELTDLRSRLKTQSDNEMRLKELTSRLNDKLSVAERWGKLNECIGSADGKAFKVIAQSYTLKLLLLYANKHLASLSRRYRLLQVPDTLALQVIDRDMCDEVRTVYSLSGGESFLISLALALGLSSLSGNGLKVESLFIDEGFGSLDADSLRVAMEALEMLRDQGRKIGVISHVQEMGERIAVQIRLRKGMGGKSEPLIEG